MHDDFYWLSFSVYFTCLRHLDTKRNMDQIKEQKIPYADELEIKSLLIRIKNLKLKHGIGVDVDREGIQKALMDPSGKSKNRQINKYIKWKIILKKKRYPTPEKNSQVNRIKKKLTQRIIELSEQCECDFLSYNRFGEIILLTIKRFLTKPNYSGYTYKDDFNSESCYKIIRYLHNFDHTKISERTGQSVNAFAYITQYIKNSVNCIINKRKKENENVAKQAKFELIKNNHTLTKNFENIYILDKENDVPAGKLTKTLYIYELTSEEIFNKINELIENINDFTAYERINIVFPTEAELKLSDYVQLRNIISKYPKLRLSGRIDVEDLEESIRQAS